MEVLILTPIGANRVRNGAGILSSSCSKWRRAEVLILTPFGANRLPTGARSLSGLLSKMAEGGGLDPHSFEPAVILYSSYFEESVTIDIPTRIFIGII